MTLLAWVLKNPLLAGSLALLLTVSTYATVQKVGRVRAEIDLKDCSSSIALQNAEIDRMAEEKAQLEVRLEFAVADGVEIMKDAKKQIDALNAWPPGGDCVEDILRLAGQLEIGR